MITCKEDLVNTYIENDNSVLRDVYVSLLSTFDFKWAEGQKADKYKNLEDFIMVDVDSDIGTRSKKLFFSTERPGIKQLTLTDLLPTSYENTKVYSLDKDVIRKYAELCGVEYNHGTIPATGEYVGVSWVMDEPDDVARFTDDSDVELGECKTTTLTTEQILSAWDLRFKKMTHDDWLTKEVNEAYEKMEAGEAEFYSSESAEQIMTLRKKRTKVEYVKCDIKDAVVLFLETNAELYAEPDESQKYDGLQDFINNMEECGSGSLYRRTEVEIDWRDEANIFFRNTIALGIDHDLESAINSESLCDEFIEMCHLIASLTPKP